MKRNKSWITPVAAGGALAIPVLPLVLYFSGNWYSILHSYSIGMVLGIVAYSYFLITLMLSARLKFLDRIFGHDRVLVFHRYLAMTAFCFAAGHFTFKTIYSFSLSTQVVLGIAGLSLFIIVMPPATAIMVTSFVHRIAAFREFKTWCLTTLRFDYSGLKLFHNITVAASVLVAIHVLLASSTQETGIRATIMSGWAALALGLYLWHKVVRPLFNLRNAYIVERLSPLSPHIVELELKPKKRPLANHRAGQFGYVRILDKASGIEEHPFTISSPPGSSSVSITVKNLGNFTARLPGISAGSKFLIDGPYGIFTPDQDGRPKLFIAGGIGITPFLSIVADWDRAGFKQNVSLLWSCKNTGDMVRRELFTACAERHREFSFVPVITGSDQKTAYANRIDRNLLEPIVIALERNRLEAYICGPERLRRSVTADLCACGILAKNVHVEHFSQ